MKTFPAVLVFWSAAAVFAADPSPVQPPPIVPQILSARHPETVRVSTYEEALALAKADGKDIVVFQYGSDWNACSLSLFQNVWNTPEFARKLGKGFILLAIDNPENPGAQPVFGEGVAKACGLRGVLFAKPATTPQQRLTAQCGDPTNFPANQVMSVTTEGGVPFVKRADGSWVTDGLTTPPPNPAKDTLTLKLKTTAAGQLLRLDFPLDDLFPNGGPGRAGNAVISEIEVAQNGVTVPAETAWGSVNGGNNFAPWTTVNGICTNSDEGWNLYGGQKQPRTLFVALKRTVPANTELTVKILCQSQWGNHVVGCVRAAMVADSLTLADVRTMGDILFKQYGNRGYSFGGWAKCPRIAFLDAAGRPVAADEQPRLGLTGASLAHEVSAWRALREKRDALWRQAGKVQGPARAELLRQSLAVMNFGYDIAFGRGNGWGGGNNGCYTFIHDNMKVADPRDESGAIRWLGCGTGEYAFTWPADNQWWKVLEGKPTPGDADWAAAEACIEKEIKDPRNKLLDPNSVQCIMKAHYDLLQRRSGTDIQDRKMAVMHRIAEYNPGTFWGIAATGMLGMHRRSGQPFLCYGWDGKYQLKSGANAWLLADARLRGLDHDGDYLLKLNFESGTNSFVVTRVVIGDGVTDLGVGKPGGNGGVGPENRTQEIHFTIKGLRDDAKPVIRLEYEAQADRFDTRGNFGLEPVLAGE